MAENKTCLTRDEMGLLATVYFLMRIKNIPVEGLDMEKLVRLRKGQRATYPNIMHCFELVDPPKPGEIREFAEESHKDALRWFIQNILTPRGVLTARHNKVYEVFSALWDYT